MKSVVSVRRSSSISKDHRRSFVALRFCSRRMPMGQDGQMSGWLLLSTAACKRSRISANAWLRKALNGLWRARNARNRPPRARSTARRKPSGWPCGWGSRRQATATGPCTCWPTKWSAWHLSMRSVTRPFGRCEKKRQDEAEDRILGHATGSGRRVRCP